MLDINLNQIGGFFVNTNFCFPDRPLFIDRNKVYNSPAISTRLNDESDFIWMIPLDRKVIPDDFENGEMPTEIIKLSRDLDLTEYIEIDINYDGDKIGYGIRFFAKKVILGNSFIGSFSYKGEAIVIKKFN